MNAEKRKSVLLVDKIHTGETNSNPINGVAIEIATAPRTALGNKPGTLCPNCQLVYSFEAVS